MNRLALRTALSACLILGSHAALAADPAAGASCTGNPEGVKVCYGNGCFKCTSSVWVAQPILAGTDATGSCTTVGLIRWSGSAMQYCNGTAWVAMSGATPPTCTGTNALHWNGSAWSCDASSGAVQSGTWCGVGGSVACLGYNPASSCPSGYTQVAYMVGGSVTSVSVWGCGSEGGCQASGSFSSSYNYSCVKN